MTSRQRIKFNAYNCSGLGKWKKWAKTEGLVVESMTVNVKDQSLNSGTDLCPLAHPTANNIIGLE